MKFLWRSSSPRPSSLLMVGAMLSLGLALGGFMPERSAGAQGLSPVPVPPISGGYTDCVGGDTEPCTTGDCGGGVINFHTCDDVTYAEDCPYKTISCNPDVQGCGRYAGC